MFKWNKMLKQMGSSCKSVVLYQTVDLVITKKLITLWDEKYDGRR